MPITEDTAITEAEATAILEECEKQEQRLFANDCKKALQKVYGSDIPVPKEVQSYLCVK